MSEEKLLNSNSAVKMVKKRCKSAQCMHVLTINEDILGAFGTLHV